ncbi:ferredoxin [Frankia sp. ACN1ag]|uniref:ferredoxin n=1 Tax=Frankia sp. ACN1ag TaxID=102891 RepID=UPI0006DCC5CC|nr:ferredoxin [Frankia sp. ACN1ag]KQC35994.1 ferredoxin [Frankia sp. ACN1ag]
MPGIPQRRRTAPAGAPNGDPTGDPTGHPDSTAGGGGPAVGPARLWIDWTACDARGWCAELLPELLTRDPDGYPLARAPGARTTRHVTIPLRLAGHARRAVDACPRLALRLLPDR